MPEETVEQDIEQLTLKLAEEEEHVCPLWGKQPSKCDGTNGRGHTCHMGDSEKACKHKKKENKN